MQLFADKRILSLLSLHCVLLSLAETATFNIKVSIYYHNKMQYEAEVNSCMFTYNQENCHQPHNAQVIRFPNPEVLTDQKRVQHILTVLNASSLLLYQKNGRIWAKRLGMCKVFHAFSKELDNPSQDPPRKLLQRNVETEIFNYEQFYRGEDLEMRQWVLFIERAVCSLERSDQTLWHLGWNN